MLATTLTAAFGVTVLTTGWFLAPMAARRRAEARLRRTCARNRTLVLTFDDGPGPTLTPKLLRLLASHGARATFFLTGFRARRHPEVVDAVVTAGHEVGCHGHDHVNAWRCWPWRAVADITNGYRDLARWVPPDGPFRPPFGKMTPLTLAALGRRGAPIGWWTIAAGDVRRDPPPPGTAAERAVRDGGGVILLHDFDGGGQERDSFVIEATTRLLEAAQRHRWRVRTLGELTHAAEGLRLAA